MVTLETRKKWRQQYKKELDGDKQSEANETRHKSSKSKGFYVLEGKNSDYIKLHQCPALSLPVISE